MIGHSVADHSTQTDESDILDLKYIIEMLRTLTLDTGQLRKDLNFAQSVLKANYEKQISDRSTELYVKNQIVMNSVINNTSIGIQILQDE